MWSYMLIGLAAGLVNGLLGVGGGTVLVPALTLWKQVPDHQAHGTTLAVILPTSVASVLVYSQRGYLDWRLALWLAAGGATGSYLGARLLERLSEATLRKVFAVFLILAGLQLLWRR